MAHVESTLASERNYISKEPIATCIPTEDALTLNGTLIGGKRVGGLFECRMSPAGLSPPRGGNDWLDTGA